MPHEAGTVVESAVGRGPPASSVPGGRGTAAASWSIQQYGKLGRMKTTVEIDESLLKAAKKRAVDEGTTLRTLVEEGLRLRLASLAADSQDDRLSGVDQFFAHWKTPVEQDRERLRAAPGPAEELGWRDSLYEERIEQLDADWEAAAARHRGRLSATPSKP